MSKDKGNKESKKEKNTEGKKSVSDYQSGKKTSSQTEITSPLKKKK